jgi:Pyruvate/2-oxoacid:ferredoxin oxidoreductase gamma subunit
MEREILFTGIGGQGIQLMAKVLADAAARAGRYAMLFGVYHGAMRGSPSDSTLVVGDAPIEAPPIVPACWSIVALHPRSLPALLPKLRPGGLFFADETLVDTRPPERVTRIAVPATRIAEGRQPLGAGIMPVRSSPTGW